MVIKELIYCPGATQQTNGEYIDNKTKKLLIVLTAKTEVVH